MSMAKKLVDHEMAMRKKKKGMAKGASKKATKSVSSPPSRRNSDSDYY